MNKLPKMYHGDISNNIRNNSDYCVVEEEKVDRDSLFKVKNELDAIFDGMGYTSRIGVIIKTSDMIYNTKIIARTSNNIITKDNDVIPIKSIISIQRKNP